MVMKKVMKAAVQVMKGKAKAKKLAGKPLVAKASMTQKMTAALAKKKAGAMNVASIGSVGMYGKVLEKSFWGDGVGIKGGSMRALERVDGGGCGGERSFLGLRVGAHSEFGLGAEGVWGEM